MKETKEVLMFVVGIGMAIDKSFANDGELTLGDAANFFEPLMALKEAGMGIEKVKDEAKNATPEQWAQLRGEIKQKFDLADDDFEAKIEASFEAGVAFVEAVLQWVKPSFAQAK